MAKQYHFVVMISSDTGELRIDWDTTQGMLEEDRGTIFDTDTQEWEVGFGDFNYGRVADKLTDKLKEMRL